MSPRSWLQQLAIRFLYWITALKAQEEAQALQADATQTALEGLRSTMAAMDEAEQYLDGEHVDPAKQEIVSAFRAGIVLMSEQVNDVLRTPPSEPDVRKDRLGGPFERSTNSDRESATANGKRPMLEPTSPGRIQGSASLPTPEPVRPSPPPSSEASEPPKRKRGRPPKHRPQPEPGPEA